MSKTLNQVSEEAWDARDVVESLSVGIQHMAQFLNKFGKERGAEGRRRETAEMVPGTKSEPWTRFKIISSSNPKSSIPSSLNTSFE